MKTLTLLLLLSSQAFAQNANIHLNIQIKDDSKGKALKNPTVIIYEAGVVKDTLELNRKGKATYDKLERNKIYTIKSMCDSYVSKNAELNTIIEDSLLVEGCERPFPIQVSLFKRNEGEDYTWVENNPIIKFIFDSKGDLTFVTAYKKE